MAARPTSTSRKRMRALVRWSAASLATTAQRPLQGEPSRRMAGLLEIACVDRFQAGLADAEAEQVAAHGGDGGRHRRPHVGFGFQHVAVFAFASYADDAWHA